MFDVGFSELVVIGLVALIVFGPEELPRVARTAGHLLGKLRRYVADVKADISREMELADLKRVQEEVRQTATELQNSINDQARSLQDEFRQAVAPMADMAQEARSAVTDPVAQSEPLALTGGDPSAGVPAAQQTHDSVQEGQPDLFSAPAGRQATGDKG